ncbi:MAG: hypothetical protein ABJF88_01845 [Rhodothermales bacterium]
MTCAFADCAHTAHWNPILVLHPAPTFRGPGYVPTYARTSLGVCDFHRTQLTPELLTPDAEWADIVRSFERAGRRRPSRAHVALTFDAVAEMTRVIDIAKPFTPPPG